MIQISLSYKSWSRVSSHIPPPLLMQLLKQMAFVGRLILKTIIIIIINNPTD